MHWRPRAHGRAAARVSDPVVPADTEPGTSTGPVDTNTVGACVDGKRIDLSVDGGATWHSPGRFERGWFIDDSSFAAFCDDEAFGG
jgi:hypothetical protein